MLASCYMIVGFGIGGSFTVDGNVFLEYCPQEKQYLLTGLSVLSAVGASIPPALALLYEILNIPYQWRFIQGTLGVIAFLLTIPRYWIEETPTFLISQRRHSDAHDLIKRMDPLSLNDSDLKDRIISASPSKIQPKRNARQQLTALLKKPLKKYTILYVFI